MAGRTRTRLAALLTKALRAEGRDVEDVKPDDLHDAKGAQRTRIDQDIYRWSGTARLRGMNVTVGVDSYTPMTRIVRSGRVVLVKDHRLPLVYEAYDATGN